MELEITGKSIHNRIHRSVMIYSHNRIFYSIAALRINYLRSQTKIWMISHTVEFKKPDTKTYILYDSIYTKK